MGLREVAIERIPHFLLRLFAGPYIAGNSLTRALTVVDQLWQQRGISSTLDLLGEGIQHRDHIAAEMREYERILEALKSRSYATLSIKPTQMGLAIDPALCLENMTALLETAQAHDTHVTIDMEESDYTDATLTLHRELRTRFDNVGTVLQARLFRTDRDIDTYLDGFTAHIRLCIGIYNEPPEIAYQTRPEMKENFLKLARKLWERGHYVCLATHDEQVLQRSLDIAEEMGISSDRYEVQMLLGVPRAPIQQALRARGITVRLYVPYGTSWDDAYAYARRRLLENPHIILYGLRNLVRRLTERFTHKPLPPPSS